MHNSCVRVYLRERLALNICTLFHWLPRLPMTLIPRCSSACMHLYYSLFSAINAATFPVLIRLFTRLPPGSRPITSANLSGWKNACKRGDHAVGLNNYGEKPSRIIPLSKVFSENLAFYLLNFASVNILAFQRRQLEANMQMF